MQASKISGPLDRTTNTSLSRPGGRFGGMGIGDFPQFALRLDQAVERNAPMPREHNTPAQDVEHRESSTSNDSGMGRTRRSERARREDAVDETQRSDNNRTDDTQASRTADTDTDRAANESTDAAGASDGGNQPTDEADVADEQADADGSEATALQAMVVAAEPTIEAAAIADVDAPNADAEDGSQQPIAIAAVAIAAASGDSDVAADDDSNSGEMTSQPAALSNALRASTETGGESLDSGTADADVATDGAMAAGMKPVAASADGNSSRNSRDGESQHESHGEGERAADAHANRAMGAAGELAPADTQVADGSASKPNVSDAARLDSAAARLLTNVEPSLAGNVQSNPSTATAKPVAAPIPAEQQFARDNLDRLVTSVRTQTLTAANGSTSGNQMNIRLDPPELGALEVAVKMVDGRMSASFTTSNDQATQLLSHSLNQLKSTLEASGVQIDRIQVRQSSDTNSSNSSSSQNSDGRSGGEGRTGQYDGNAQQNNQQRREAVERMWRRFAYGADDLDLVA